MKKIRITLHPDGTQQVEVLGAVGEECVELTRELERRLGSADGERVLKREYEETEEEIQREREVE